MSGRSIGATKMWPLMPTILLEQLLAEAVHHRQHDDQRRDAEHDADEGEAGDDRDEALAPARAQIAPGEHPLEGGEGRAVAALAIVCSFGRMANGACTVSPLDAPLAARQPRRHVGERQHLPLARRAALQLDLALGEAARADDDLPGQADQVGGGELGARALVAVVVEHVAAGGVERARRARAQARVRRRRRRP